MKKISKLMTVAGCALVIGGGLSLYAATRSTGDIQPLADETYPVAILYGDRWNMQFAYDDCTATSAFFQGDHNIVFGYDPTTKTAKNFKDQYQTISEKVTVTKTGDPSFNLVLDNMNVNWYYIKNEGWLTDGMAVSISYGGWSTEFEPGEYTFNIPAGLVQFADDTWNEEANLTFTIAGSMQPTWTVNSQYIPLADATSGVSFSFEDVTSVEVVDDSQTFQINNQDYQASQLKIEGNTVTLPALEVEDGSRLSIYFPQGYFKGTSGSGLYISTYVDKSYTVWGGMSTRATCLTQLPTYLTELNEITIQWPGEAVTLPGGETEGDISVTFGGSVYGTYELPCKIVPSDQTGTNNLVISNITSEIQPGAMNSNVTVTIPKNAVENSEGLGNLEEQVASFNYVKLFTAEEISITSSVNNGIVKVVATSIPSTYSIWGFAFTSVYPLVEILEGNNVVATLNQNDLSTLSYPDYGFSFDMSEVSGLFPNRKYTMRINEFAFNLSIDDQFGDTMFDVNSFKPYCPEYSFEIENELTLSDEGGLGDAILQEWESYPGTTYTKPVTSFNIYWQENGENVPVKLFDPTKITGSVGGDDMGELSVSVSSYSNVVTVKIPEDFQDNYKEFIFNIGENFVYSGEKSNAASVVKFAPYGQLANDSYTVIPAVGQVTSEQLQKVIISWADISNDELIDGLQVGEASISLRQGSVSTPIDKQYITVEDETNLVLNLSNVQWNNGGYSIDFAQGAVIATTDYENTFINSNMTLDYYVWDGIEEAEVTGTSGMMSESTALASDGIYTLTWGQNVTPTVEFTVICHYYVGSLSGQEEVELENMSFLTADGETANWANGGMTLKLDVKDLIAKVLGEDFTNVWFIIEQGSVYAGNNKNAINPRQSFGLIQIQELAEQTATISGPADGIITISWTNAYQLASIKDSTGLQLLDSDGEVIDTFNFQTDVWQSPVVTKDPESPLQFLLTGDTYAYGFTLNLNELGLPYGTNDYTLVLPEGWLQVVDINKRNEGTYQPPINGPQEFEFSFTTYGLYEGPVVINPLSGAEVEILDEITVTFPEATSINLVGKVIVNGQELEEGATVSGNVLTIVPGVVDDEEVTIEIESGAIVIDGMYINEAIEATYTQTSVGIAGIYAENGRYEVYTVAGVHVLSTGNASALNNLENGLYIINGKKVYIRK